MAIPWHGEWLSSPRPNFGTNPTMHISPRTHSNLLSFSPPHALIIPTLHSAPTHHSSRCLYPTAMHHDRSSPSHKEQSSFVHDLFRFLCNLLTIHQLNGHINKITKFGQLSTFSRFRLLGHLQIPRSTRKKIQTTLHQDEMSNHSLPCKLHL